MNRRIFENKTTKIEEIDIANDETIGEIVRSN